MKPSLAARFAYSAAVIPVIVFTTGVIQDIITTIDVPTSSPRSLDPVSPPSSVPSS